MDSGYKTDGSLALASSGTAGGEIALVPPAAVSPWWRVGDFAVLGVWISVVAFILPYHEKWADEAQAWLIARDLDLRTIWFHELRYEGSPGLWHTILWVAQHVFHAKYDAIGYIGAAGALAGVALLIFAAPFPRYIRWPLAFTYFMVYQYAVIARPYTLFLFFSLLAVRGYHDLKRPDLFAVGLAPLAILTAHGSVLALSLGLSYAVTFMRRWPDAEGGTRRRFVSSVAAMFLLYVILFLVLLPPKDTEAIHQDPIDSITILHRTLGVVGGALVDNGWVSIVLLCALGVWCYLRRELLLFSLSVGLLVILYIYTAGWPHYQGTVFIAILSCLAIAWPRSEESGGLSARELQWQRVVVAVLFVTMGYQIYAAAVVVRNEVNLPYSGASDAARYLGPEVAAGKTIYGYQYGMVALNAYFDRNIFANWPRAYYHHSLSEFNPAMVSEQVKTGAADYVVIVWFDAWDGDKFDKGLRAPMATWGYSLAHVSDGYLLSKTGYSHRQIYLVFRKEQLPVVSPPIVQ
jgi:hypothetical protein